MFVTSGKVTTPNGSPPTDKGWGYPSCGSGGVQKIMDYLRKTTAGDYVVARTTLAATNGESTVHVLARLE